MNNKELSEMTLEQLWQLFPIFLVEHNDNWETYYQEMKKQLQEILVGFDNVKIHHIGSTAIKDMMAKNIVDVLVEIDNQYDLLEVAKQIEKYDFIIMSESEKRISLNKGYTKDGFAQKVFHIHLRYYGDNDELYFRDYLNDNPDIAKEYENLKLQLWHQYEHDRDGYTNSKTEFINKYTTAAKEIYQNRY